MPGLFLLECAAPDGQPLPAEYQLEIGLFFRCALHGGDFGKARVGAEDGDHLFVVGNVIGRHLEDAALFEAAVDEVGKAFGDEATLVVAFLRPRVGEEKVEGLNTAFGEHPREAIGGFEAEHTDVLEAVVTGFLVDAADAVELALDAEVLHVRIGFGACDEEASFAAADVDFHWTRGVEDAIKGQRFRDVVRGNDKACLCLRHMGKG